MAARALPHLRRGRVFIAIGALHLPGEAGMLRQLVQSGWKAVPVW